MGNDNSVVVVVVVVVSHKLCGFQGRMGGQCSACSNFVLRSPGKLHN
jgi:hypothetical protein